MAEPARRARPVTLALLRALCRRLGYDPDRVRAITITQDVVVVDLLMVTDLGCIDYAATLPVVRTPRRG